MPQVVAYVAVYVATVVQAAVAYFSTAAVATAAFWTAYYGSQLALYYGISRVSSRRPSIPSLRTMGMEVNVRDPAAPRQIIYGQRRVSGVLYPIGTSGTNNEYLHLILLLAGHPCNELGEITFNDEVVPLDGSGNATGRYAGFVRVKKHLGEYNQTVDTDLQTDLGAAYWSNNHRLQGIAHLIVRLKVSADLFPGGIPEIYCLTKGRMMYDHRDGTHDAADAATWDWSANAALCEVDWLRGVPTRNSAGTVVRNYGVGAADDEIDYTDADAAANVCDESVVTDGPSSESRYTCNGVMLTSVRSGDGIELLKTAMAGDCVFVSGKWIVFAGAYRTPTLGAFDEGDLRAPLTGVRLKPATGDLVNVGRGIYVAAGNNWQPTDLPEVRNATYITQDGGEVLPLDLEFPFTTSAATGQRLLKIAIERSRQGISFVAKCKLSAWQVRTGDVIPWTDAELGWSSKAFEVLGVALAVENDANNQPYLGVDLTLRETASAVWDWANGEETTVDLAPNTLLRSPFDITNPTSLNVANSVAQQEDGTAVPRLSVTWTAPADANVLNGGFIRMEYKLAAATDWLPAEVLRGDITAAYILGVVIGQSYNVRIRSETGISQSQTWVTSGSVAVTGDTTAPSAPTGLTAVAGTGKAVSLDWNDNTEDDFSEYKVFRNTVNNSATATEIAEVRASRFVDIEVSFGTAYFYWLKAVDTSENVSGAFSAGASATPTLVTDGSVDTTAPSTPSAPTFSSEATYTGGDGSVYASITIACPALPAGAKLNQVLHRVSGSTAWTIDDELFASGNKTVDDLTPGVAYEFAIRSISFSNVPSSVSSTLSRTSPNKTSGPSAPGSGAVNSNAITNLSWSVSAIYYGARATWVKPSNADFGYFEVKCTSTDTDGATDYIWENAPIITQASFYDFYRASVILGYVRVRAYNNTGVASSWTRCGELSSVALFQSGAGTMALQNKGAVAVTGGTATGITNIETTAIKTGNGSSVQKVLCRYVDQVSVSLSGGAPSEDFDVSLTNRGFGTKPDTGHLTCIDPLYLIAYNSSSGSSTSTNARCTIRSTDGSNIPTTTTPVAVTFEEKD